MCGGRSNKLHYGRLIETNNLYAPTPKTTIYGVKYSGNNRDYIELKPIYVYVRLTAFILSF